MCSTCHDQHNQVLAPFDPTSSQTYVDGVSNDRHFQRVDNSSGAMCGDCHASRDVGMGGTSHPVHVNVASAPNMKVPSASAVLSIAGNVECLSCHTVHNAPASDRHAGMLLRASSSATLCADCHTLANMTGTGAHMNPASGMLWPGDQYGGSTYPAYTQPEDRGACMNCHTPHGWPDASNPTQSYPLGLGAQKTNLCLTCHDSDGPSTKDVRAQVSKAINHPMDRTTGRQVGCVDCHNPHMASAGVHTYGATADADRNRLRAATGGVLNNAYALSGVDGVAFHYSGLGMWSATTADNYTVIPSGSPTVPASGAEFEYQICFKCHTSYAFGSTPPSGQTTTTTNLTKVSGSTQPWLPAAGTAQFTNGSSTVTGTGTNWTTATMAGLYIRPAGGSVNTYRVKAVTSQTTLTLSATFGQATTVPVAFEARASAAITTTTTVTGYGTAFTQAMVNQLFAMVQGATVNSFRIAAVPSATTLTLATPATISGTPQDFYIHPSAGFTAGSKAVVGYGTAWTSSLVGSLIQGDNQPGPYVIASVQDATHLTVTANFTGTTGINRYLLAGAMALQETDLGQEFNPANRSGHPVVVGLSSYSGNLAPKALSPAALKAPWNTNVGTQTMMCSDCHGTDAASPAAQGPHGSAAQFMLKGANPGNWPDVDVNAASTSWCANCHTLSQSINVAHAHGGTRCWACHVVIPHGSKMSRLLGYSGPGTTMPARYAYKNTVGYISITGFKKASSATGYSDVGNCQTTCYHTDPVPDSETW
jgi:predicted CXXCH cytochrome family protein